MQMRGNALMFELIQGGIASESSCDVTGSWMGWFVQNPGITQWRGVCSGLFQSDFRDLVDGLIREGEAAG